MYGKGYFGLKMVTFKFKYVYVVITLVVFLKNVCNMEQKVLEHLREHAKRLTANICRQRV